MNVHGDPISAPPEGYLVEQVGAPVTFTERVDGGRGVCPRRHSTEGRGLPAVCGGNPDAFLSTQFLLWKPRVHHQTGDVVVGEYDLVGPGQRIIWNWDEQENLVR